MKNNWSKVLSASQTTSDLLNANIPKIKNGSWLLVKTHRVDKNLLHQSFVSESFVK